MGRPIRNSEALQAVKWGIVVGAQESCAHGKGPEGEGRERVQRYPANAQSCPRRMLCGAGEMDISCNIPLS